jgi:site-specific recombinase XerD
MNALVTIAGATEAALVASLTDHAAAARGAFARNTERALRADVAIFTAWCADAGRTALPASAATVAAFIDEMAERKAPATIRRYISSVSTFHRAAAAANPTEALVVKLALKRLHREKGRAQKQAAPLNRQHVEKMLAAGGDRPGDFRDRALLAVAYDTLCRRSELVALQMADIEHGTDGAATVIVRKSKTDQEGVGMIRYLAADTMAHVRAWIAAADLADGPLFRAVLKGGHVGGALNGAEVARIYKAMAEAAGLTAAETAGISGHSTRVGAAQDMVRSGLELPVIMQAGGWRSAEMVARYTARLDARRSGAAKLAVMQNRA